MWFPLLSKIYTHVFNYELVSLVNDCFCCNARSTSRNQILCLHFTELKYFVKRKKMCRKMIIPTEYSQNWLQIYNAFHSYATILINKRLLLDLVNKFHGFSLTFIIICFWYRLLCLNRKFVSCLSTYHLVRYGVYSQEDYLIKCMNRIVLANPYHGIMAKIASLSTSVSSILRLKFCPTCLPLAFLLLNMYVFLVA